MPVPFPITTYTDIEGNPIANGYLIIRLSQDAFVSKANVVCSQRVVKIPLNSSGQITGSFNFWPNYLLTPSNTYYTLRAYSSAGQLVLGPLYVTVVGALSALVLIDTVTSLLYTVSVVSGNLTVTSGGSGGVSSVVLLDTLDSSPFSLVVTNGNLVLNSGGSGGVTAIGFIDTVTNFDYSLQVTAGNLVVAAI